MATEAPGDAPLLLAFPDEAALAQALARELGATLALIHEHRFPDGELKLRLPPALPERVTLLRGLQDPNHKLVALLLAARTARTLGARRLDLVSPYLAYMRQDMAFHPGEAVSQRIVAGFLGELFDRVVTIDPHLHRINSLDEVMPGSRGIALGAAPLLGCWIAAQWPGDAKPLLVGPDEEAGQWVQQAGAAGGLAGIVCTKTRRGDRDVTVELPGHTLRGRAVVLIDDLASTGHTLVQAARALFAQGAASVDAAVVHALFRGDALQQLRAAGIGRVWSTDAVAHETNVISVAPLLARALRQA
ncbi:MAG: ribose-phosphate diphosphokinase [Piscinibacter sp.]|uniref:ribose-phosphate diphosphokinase n=1 Tax=Piscinibacter sp. TaxID=1903157 RepID=UPI0025897E55|nr:ribose-phosphate diphosphokinase [Piscinibacter sp.]MCW5666983.1 ribose-phosphate diphosphokinase [Piscinibacter sp.]